MQSITNFFQRKEENIDLFKYFQMCNEKFFKNQLGGLKIKTNNDILTNNKDMYRYPLIQAEINRIDKIKELLLKEIIKSYFYFKHKRSLVSENNKFLSYEIVIDGINSVIMNIEHIIRETHEYDIKYFWKCDGKCNEFSRNYYGYVTKVPPLNKKEIKECGGKYQRILFEYNSENSEISTYTSVYLSNNRRINELLNLKRERDEDCDLLREGLVSNKIYTDELNIIEKVKNIEVVHLEDVINDKVISIHNDTIDHILTAPNSNICSNIPNNKKKLFTIYTPGNKNDTYPKANPTNIDVISDKKDKTIQSTIFDKLKNKKSDLHNTILPYKPLFNISKDINKIYFNEETFKELFKDPVNTIKIEDESLDG